MSAWTSVPKPTDATYTRVTLPGKQTYDDSNISYDDSSTYYDSVDMFAWTEIAKPTSSAWTAVAKPTT